MQLLEDAWHALMARSDGRCLSYPRVWHGVKCRYAIYDRSRVHHRLRATANPAALLAPVAALLHLV
jgi:hypothetical protein